jgi:hypothetical protein
VDGKSDWLISIMKDFDWLQVHINNSFKNNSVKGTIFSFMPLWQKINQTNSILKGLNQNL